MPPMAPVLIRTALWCSCRACLASPLAPAKASAIHRCRNAQRRGAPQEGSGSEVAVGVLLEAPAPPKRQYVRESQGVAAFYELWQARQERCASCACAVELLHLLWRALESRNSSNHPIIITASPYRVAQLFDPVRAQNTDSSPSSALALSTRDWGWGRSADRGTCGAMVSSEQNTGTSGGGAAGLMHTR